jgi:hypothetical protein
LDRNLKTRPVSVRVAVSQVDRVVVVREVDGEGQRVAVAVLLVEDRLVAVVPEERNVDILTG